MAKPERGGRRLGGFTTAETKNRKNRNLHNNKTDCNTMVSCTNKTMDYFTTRQNNFHKHNKYPALFCINPSA